MRMESWGQQQGLDGAVRTQTEQRCARATKVTEVMVWPLQNISRRHLLTQEKHRVSSGRHTCNSEGQDGDVGVVLPQGM